MYKRRNKMKHLSSLPLPLPAVPPVLAGILLFFYMLCGTWVRLDQQSAGFSRDALSMRSGRFVSSRCTKLVRISSCKRLLFLQFM